MKLSFLLLWVLLLHVCATELDKNSQEQQQHCCLPMKWHSRMVKANYRTYQRLGPIKSKVPVLDSQPSRVFDVFVNYRRPRFELRSLLGSSMVFWRGHMWTFRPGAHIPEHLSQVSDGFRPSNGLAPFFFRCLAAENGFQRLNATHYRLSEPDNSTPASRRLRIGSVTNIYVVPTNDTTSGRRRRSGHTCLLAGYTVSARYFKHMDEGRSIALVNEADAYWPQKGVLPTRRQGWPDRQFTDQARSFRKYYRGLIRANRIKFSRPHLHVAVPGHVRQREDEDETASSS